MTTKIIVSFACLISLFRIKGGKIESRIAGGRLASITKFPHSAFVSIQNEGKGWGCGSAILTNYVVLTAGHCVNDCWTDYFIAIAVGHESKLTGFQLKIHRFIIHAGYDEDTFENDLAVMSTTQTIVFNDRVKRVALYRHPPYNKMATVAGWGVVDEVALTETEYLQEAHQMVENRSTCLEHRHFKTLPTGVFCAKPPDETHGYAASGDSGSGLVVNNYILLGLVSFKRPSVSTRVVLYTDIGTHYDWIKHNVQYIICYSG